MIIFSLIHSSITESYRSIESSKGIYSIYIYDFPYWILNIITNDFINLNYIDKFIHYINIVDLIAVLGSIDSVLGSVDLLPVNRGTEWSNRSTYSTPPPPLVMPILNSLLTISWINSSLYY